MEFARNWLFRQFKNGDRPGQLLSYLMKKNPIHQNLNTSFVNLAAMVGFLRDLQFVGRIRVELSSYEAEITFCENGLLEAREHDHKEERISVGDDALRRILIRSTEPFGHIEVYQEDMTDEFEKIFIDKAISEDARQMIANNGQAPARDPRVPRTFRTLSPITFETANTPASGKAEDIAQLQDWRELLAVTEELLRTIDEALAKGGIDFQAAFQNACGHIAEDFSFMEPEDELVDYQNGRLTVHGNFGIGRFTAAIGEAIGRILTRLSEEARFGNSFHLTKHRIRVLMQRRNAEVERFGLGSQLEKAMRII